MYSAGCVPEQTFCVRVYGSGDSGTLKAGRQTRELFLFNLDGDNTSDNISVFLSDNGIHLIEIECRSRDESMNKSFRIMIDNADNDNVMQPELWPSRVGIRPYFR